MALSNCIITNYSQDNIDISTTIYEGSGMFGGTWSSVATGTTSLAQTMGINITGSNTVPRAIRLRISPKQINNDNPNQDCTEGYWSICTRDLSISGFSGWQQWWWNNSFEQEAHNSNPLKLTEYDPWGSIYDDTEQYGLGHLINNDPSTNNTVFNLSGVNNGDQLYSYKWFPYQDVCDYGDCGEMAGIDGEILQQNETYLGVFNWTLPYFTGTPRNTTIKDPGPWCQNDPNHGETSGGYTLIENSLSAAVNNIDSRIKGIMMTNTLPMIQGDGDGLLYGQQDNHVDVFVLLNDNVGLDEDTTLTIDIDGDAKWNCTAINPSLQKGMAFGESRIINGSIDFVYDDNEMITLVSKGRWKLEELEPNTSIIKSDIGLNLSRKKLYGKIVSNSRRVVGEIKIEAPDGEYFLKRPYLETPDNVSLVLKNKIRSSYTTKKNNNVFTSYTFDILYKDTVNRSSNSIHAKLKYTETGTLSSLISSVEPVGGRISSIKVYSDSNGYSNDVFLNSNRYTPIDENGESKTIKITGTPGSTFGIAVNERIESTQTIGDVTRSFFDRANDVSILKNPNATSSSLYGEDMPVLKGTIDSTGSYYFVQKFPKSIATRAKTTATKSSTTSIEFDDNTSMKVGDEVRGNSAELKANKIKIDSINANGTTVVLDTAISIDTNASCEFRRKRYYSIEVIPELTSTNTLAHVDGMDIDPLYSFIQCPRVIITIKNKTVDSNLKIEKNNNVNTGLAAGASLVTKLTGKAGSVVNSTTPFSMFLDVQNSDNFTAVTVPTFSGIYQSSSTFTNSLSEVNGKNKFTITSITSDWTSSANNFTLGYNFNLTSFGYEDVTIELDIDAITTIAEK